MLSFAITNLLFSQTPTISKFEKRIFIQGSDTLPYRILFPKNFNPNKKYALIFVLHGIGERGNDNEVQLVFGSKLFLNDTIRAKYPAIVVYPQCPLSSYWINVKVQPDGLGKWKFNFVEGGEPSKAMGSLVGLVSELRHKPYVNKRQMYVGGLSMGGMGTYEILRRIPNVFAAAFPICGGDNPLNAKIYAKKVSLWIFHGAKDDVVPAHYSHTMFEAIKLAGGNPKLTIYPNDGHNSWDDAFAEPNLIPWLFSHKN